MSKPKIRMVEREDIPEILEIYAPYVLQSAVSFEETVPSEDEFWQRIQTIMKDCPFLVCEIDSKVAGYAYASMHRPRAAYRWAKEVSVYVHPGFRRKNIAKALYSCLIEIVRFQGIYTLLAIITLPNEASVKLHENMGFKQCAEFKNIGYKLGQWQTVGWWELQLVDQFLTPDEFIPLPKLSFEIINTTTSTSLKLLS